MKNIYIHVGFGKTGTSFLQSAFAYNYEKYKTNNLIYPDISKNHHQAALGEVTSGNGLYLAAASKIEALKKIPICNIDDLSKSLNGDCDYLISSEWLISCGVNFFENLKIKFNKHNIIYICIVRDPVDHIISSYLQGLKTGIFLSNIIQCVDNLIKSERHLIDNLRKISLENELILINYDFHKNKLLQEIEKIILNKELSQELPFELVNKSPNMHQAEILRLVNELGMSNFGLAMKYLEDDNSSGKNYRRFTVSNETRNYIYTQLNEDLIYLNSKLNSSEKIKKIFSENDEKFNILFNQSDINFFKNLLSNSLLTQDDLSFIKKSTTLEANRQLPKDFNPTAYLLYNLDVLKAKVNPVEHFIKYGKKEGRVWK